MKSKEDTERQSDQAVAEGTPPCFGDPATVCPKDERGFFQPQEKCLSCSVVKACLQKALRAAGVLPTPILESPAATRLTGFLKRWSRQKLSQNQSSQVKP